MKKQANKPYFTRETEEYIIKYNNSSDPIYRAEIFSKHIYYPFYKLVENLIHSFKFYYTDVDDLEHLKQEIITVLLEEKISKFDATNGAKAYSYFGTIVKNWLINYNNKNYKTLKIVSSLDVAEEIFEDPSEIEVVKRLSLSSFIDLWVNSVENNLEKLLPKPHDRNVAEAILTLFRTRQDLGIFRKKALYIYIREITECETPQLTGVLAVLKKDFYSLYSKYYEKGLIDRKEF